MSNVLDLSQSAMLNNIFFQRSVLFYENIIILTPKPDNKNFTKVSIRHMLGDLEPQILRKCALEVPSSNLKIHENVNFHN
ncbi:hypothetical protein BB561_006457 [Smittium simulii]|uniref:Uncharacterized protein n=1 Tax=Smittium simulii TaxID=133385 RepID=A0A2T9Y432_9FUNG|nr:hypothetical protein BB561_006457 [Smittium simulii]